MAEILDSGVILPKVQRLMVDFVCWHVAPECFYWPFAGFVGVRTLVSYKAKVMEPKQATHWQSMYCFKNIKNLGYWDNIRGLLLDVYSPPYAKKPNFCGVLGQNW